MSDWGMADFKNRKDSWATFRRENLNLILKILMKVMGEKKETIFE